MRGLSYKAPISLSFAYQVNGETKEIIQENIGEIPIMVKSKICNIAGLKPKELVKHLEDVEEFGGYFIINGREKIMRFLTAPRRNYVRLYGLDSNDLTIYKDQSTLVYSCTS